MQEKRKLCFVTTVSLTMRSFVVETAKYLHDTLQCDVTLICSPDEEFAASLPEYLHYIPVSMNRGMDLSALKSIWQFIRIFRRERFDLVQYSTPNAACYASIAARITKVPIRLYAQWGIRYTGMTGVTRKLFRLIEKMVCRNSTVIRAQSFLNMEFSISEGLYAADKVGVVGYGGTIGVDMQRYDMENKGKWRKEIREKYGLSNEDFVFGFSGRITVDKGCRELLSAFKSLVDKGLSAKLFIVGPVDDNCGIDKDLISWANRSSSVVMTGAVDNSNMCKYYSAMDVLTHPTYREGFGMVLQEAGALGVPSITTKVPGASEVFEDGVSAVLVAAKDPVELEKAMKKLSTNPDMTVQLGTQAYERTKTRYDRPVMLDNQQRDYKKILGV
ncbi:MAG: glycosyltransferase [Oscillospiraceae bacterium]|nr:glycosyltransferase [Oscillospiraceae bacterium]